jgi:hypothetical protein
MTEEYSFKNAIRLLGIEKVRSMLPRPLQLIFSDHSTGCQIEIEAKSEGVYPMLIWRSSEWYSDRYKFNDHGLTMGLQPNANFAKDVINKFFSNVRIEFDKHMATRQQRKKLSEENENRTKDYATNHYKNLLVGAKE